MSLTRHILGSSAQLTAANAIARVLGIVSLPLLTRWLSPDAYGQAALASTLMSLVSMIGLMGMDMSYARTYLSRAEPNGSRVEIFCWRFSLVAALAAGLVAAMAWLLHVARDGSSLPVVACWVLIGTAGSVLLAMAQTRSRLHNQHTRLAVAIALSGIAATALTLCIARWWLPDERALVTGFVLAYVLPICVMGIPALKKLRLPSGLSSATRKAVFFVGVPGVVTAPMYWILSSSDRWFLQTSADASTVGVYAVACTFGQLGMMVNSALLAIWLPEATRLHESDDSGKVAATLGGLICRLVLVMMMVWVGVGIIGGDLLRWLSEGRFHGGAAVVPWIASAVFFYGCYHLANTGLFLGRRLRVSAFVWAFVGAASLLANAIFVPRFGMLAAAGVQCGTFGVLAITVFVLSQRHHPIQLPAFRMLVAFAIAVLGLLIGVWLPEVRDWLTAVEKVVFVGVIVTLLAAILAPDVCRRGMHALFAGNALDEGRSK